MATSLFGETLVRGRNPVPTASIDADVIMIYFSAHWCPPCRGFTPELVKSYHKMKAAGKSFETVFVSSDKDQKAFQEYFGEMPWLALPFEDRERKEKLSSKFKVRGIPTLVVLDGKTGALITAEGREKVSQDPAGDNFPWTPATFAESLGSVFVDNKGEKYGLDHLQGKVIGLYFSAHWCGPCRNFTPSLVETYKALKATGAPFEIVFCSSDQDEHAFAEYFGEMPWLALPFSERKRKEDLSAHFKVEGIPTLVILQDTNGKVITEDGRSAVDADPTGQEFPWNPKPVNGIEVGAAKLNESAGLVVFVNDDAEEKRVQAILRPFAEAYIAQAISDGADPDLVFITCQNKVAIAARVKQFMKWGTVAEGVSVGILSIPQGGAFHSSIKDVSADAVAAFVEQWKQGKLPKLSLR